MKMIKLSSILTLALIAAMAGTGCAHRTGHMTNMPSLKNPAPPEPSDAGTLNNNNAGGGSEPAPFNNPAEDRQTLAAQSIYFNYDSAAVKKTERSKVDAVAQALKSDSSAKLKIEGNCDERGTEEYNRALGEKRALAARGALVKMGISASRISTISNG